METNKVMQEENDWMRNRIQNYQQFSDRDIGHIYDMIQSILDAYPVTLKPDDQLILDHRKAIKSAYPKS